MDIPNRNIFYKQEISSEQNTLKIKIFDYYYYLINGKNETKLFTLYFFHFLEIMQILSYAFSYPHLVSWKISEKSIRIISLITSGFRLSPLLQLI